MRAAAVLLVLLTVRVALAVPGPRRRPRQQPRRPLQPVADFLADFLDYQSQAIAPAHVSGVLCRWSHRDVARALSARGLPARVIAIPDHDKNTVLEARVNASAPAQPAAQSSHRNRLFQRARLPPEALAALRHPALAAWLIGLAARGKPGDPHEEPLAEEVFLDMNCPLAGLVLQVASDANLFRRPYRWVLLQQQCSGEDIASSTPTAALADSQVVVACLGAAGGGSVRVLEVHRPALGADPVAAPLASWGPAVGLSPQLLKRGDVARTLQGVTVPTGIALLDSNNSIHHLTDGAEKALDQLTKTTFTILLQAYELMNATVSLHVTNSHGYVRNGKLDGLLGELADGVVEIGGTATLPVPFRMVALVYSGFPIPMRALTVFRRPPLAYTDNMFWLPFPDSLWAAALGLVGLCCLLAVLALHLENHLQHRLQRHAVPEIQVLQAQGAGRGAPKQPLRASLSDVFLLAFGAIAQQGSPVEARGVVGRIVTFLLFLAVLLLYTCYSASIVAILQSSSTSIRSLRDLWKSRLDVGAENMPYNVYFIEQYAKMGDEVRSGLFYDKIARPGRPRNFMSMSEGVRRMQAGLFAFVAMDSPLYGQIQARFEEHEKCDLFELDEYSQLRHPHLVTRRDSPITHILKVKLFLQWERGFRSRFIQRSLYTKPRCDVHSARFTRVSFVAMRYAYYLILGGSVLAVAVLLVEMVYGRLAGTSKGQDADDDRGGTPTPAAGEPGATRLAFVVGGPPVSAAFSRGSSVPEPLETPEASEASEAQLQPEEDEQSAEGLGS
nr:ionotropic receptor [Odontothrips loti]